MKFGIRYIFALVIPAGTIIAHPGSVLLPEGCGSCHVGHGVPEQPMLEKAEENLCYQCHGADDRRAAMVYSGRLSAAAELADIETEFRKAYRHPVEESGEHSPVERLPKVSGAGVTHAECVDCHNPHQRARTGRSEPRDVAGYSLSGQYLESSVHEYEICLKCHTDLGGGVRTESDISSQFQTTVRSMHPVTRVKVGPRSRSLTASLSGGATMDCSDCHRSSDPAGPRGPHGSDYPYLLSGNYVTDGWADESPLAYQFCYSCHDRTSLLSDESFPLHRDHIVGDQLSNRSGTSCFTCHASHSSGDHPYLISFNPEVVSRSRQTNRIDFETLGSQTGRCYLTCHGYSHDPAEY